MKAYKVSSVKPVAYPIVAVTLEDGLAGEIDLWSDIRPGSTFEPLADRDLFDTVSVAPGGRAIGWRLDAVGHEIDLGADSLRIDIETHHVRQLARRFKDQRPAAE